MCDDVELRQPGLVICTFDNFLVSKVNKQAMVKEFGNEKLCDDDFWGRAMSKHEMRV